MMEHIPSIAWRNCVNGTDNHGQDCSQFPNGMFYDPDYTHQTAFWVFRQERRITLHPGMKQSGCNLNSLSSYASPFWLYSDILRFMDDFDLTLHAATFFRQPYSPMVDRILCKYQFCLGGLPFLAGSTLPDGTPGIAGVTDKPECGQNGLVSSPWKREPIDWTLLYCKDCQYPS